VQSVAHCKREYTSMRDRTVNSPQQTLPCVQSSGPSQCASVRGQVHAAEPGAWQIAWPVPAPVDTAKQHQPPEFVAHELPPHSTDAVAEGPATLPPDPDAPPGPPTPPVSPAPPEPD
jgi:hypothetical protein